ncbi:ATP-binding cassette domain-containing protein [Paraliomyxa miuraensis]|uniref:ATP-binding cassette domain-containing protein n=1 Tax=Paraliomyxa miuraensis TaxID=376150 RepID=UPI0022511FF4|nr:ATP-binding cassette domain-containing protein [Paraliomyxa miuraensis]MCX4245434.1 ATP-binding cassette domain-containing protein [Paraliomyxa miuraensis]
MGAPLLEARGLCVDTWEGRPLFRELSMSFGRDRAALVGRNGVGKSTLLRLLAGEDVPERGSLVRRVQPLLVRQQLDAEEVERAAARLRERALDDAVVARAIARDAAEAGLPAGLPAVLEPRRGGRSGGEARKLLLLWARHSGAELLLLDEPTEDLDEEGIAWLCRWLRTWPHGVIVVSHHRDLLRCFEDFLVVAESGCRHVRAEFDALVRTLQDEEQAAQQQYARNLEVLAQQERRDERIRRRRERKKNVGRLHELRRCTSRCRLNEKRSYAQESQARVAKIRDARIGAARAWAKATRRALAVTLPLDLASPALPEPDGRAIVSLEGVSMAIGGVRLWSGLDLAVARQRIAVVGPNGAGKTTLLQVMQGRTSPTEGAARSRPERIGAISQGATEWISDQTLLSRLQEDASASSLHALAEVVVAHRFPLALAERPLWTLSPGERVRAALICLFQRAPRIELLVLDEPTFGLDFVGIAALQRALAAWPGGLVVASHDRELLEGIGVEQWLALDGRGGLSMVGPERGVKTSCGGQGEVGPPEALVDC